MKNAADVLHQQQHSIELASAISKIRLHFLCTVLVTASCACSVHTVVGYEFTGYLKVSVQGVVALGGHFATLCRELDFYEAIFFCSLLIFKKKRQILLHF